MGRHPGAPARHSAARLRVACWLLLCSLGSSPVRAADPPPEFYTPARDSLFILERFTRPRDLGQFPSDWEGRTGWRKSTTRNAEDLYYTIQLEDGDYFLRAQTEGRATDAGRVANVNLRLYNRLRWRWRVHSLPEGGNEEVKDKNDSGAAVRLVFRGGVVPKTLKYVWSATLPAGTETESPSSDRTKVVVLRSGTDHLGDWAWEEVDAYDDYKRLFGGEPRIVEVLAVITDSDNTNSPVKADYDDFVFIVGSGDGSSASVETSDSETDREP